MSRCFPFPPPGYERKTKAVDTDLLKKVNTNALSFACDHYVHVLQNHNDKLCVLIELFAGNSPLGGFVVFPVLFWWELGDIVTIMTV